MPLGIRGWVESYLCGWFTPIFWRYLRWRPPHILWNCLNSWNLFLIFIVPLTYLEVIFVSPVLEACCYGACLQPTPRYCSESGEACRFPCCGNASACKVIKSSGWKMNPASPPKRPMSHWLCLLARISKASCHLCWCHSLRWPIYVINSVDNTKIPCYALPLTR